MPKTQSSRQTDRTGFQCSWGILKLPVLGIVSAIQCDLHFVSFTVRQQHGLGVIQVTALLAVVFIDACFDDGIHRTGFFAETAKNAFGQVDVVLRGAARTVCTLRHFDLDRHCRANRLAQLAGDAALLTVRITALRMQTAEAEALWRLFLRIFDGDVAREEITPGHRETLEQFEQQETLEEIY